LIETLKIALYVTACLHGFLHGVPTDICREFQIRAFDSVPTCTKSAASGSAEWLDGLRQIGIDAFIPAVRGWRCAQRTFDDLDP
jgi:hypothetical protein